MKAQATIFQNIRGRVIDLETNLPVTGAAIYIPGTDPLVGAASDTTGRFFLEKVSVGRISVEISCLGYKTRRIDDIILTSAKELYIEISLLKDAILIETLVVRSGLDKHSAINPMASVSARSFSIEETYRYAGGLGDPARMAANFAGVMAESPQRNDIIVRGNSPAGLLWRLDGIEIPNPNHFGTIGTTGGPVTILNNNLLTNSDFLTGAFPAEYGNALAGVFDLRMRKGNPYRREFWGQFGWNGFELGAEGGFSKNHEASYLASFRYTFLGLIGKLGIIGYMPEFQDMTVKLDFPTKKSGEFALIAMEGTSRISILDSGKPQEEWTFTGEGEDIHLKTGLALIGLNHHITLDKKLNLRQFISVQQSLNKEHTDTFSIDYPSPFTDYHQNSTETKYSLSSMAQFRSGRFLSFHAGITGDLYHVQFSDSSWQSTGFRVRTLIDEYLVLMRGFIQVQKQLVNQISLTGGIYSQFLLLNSSFSIEPRAGVKWIIDDKHAINFGYGIHSQLIPRPVYFFRSYYPDGSYALTNTGLDFSKSHHFIAGYDYAIFPDLRLKAEVYYQYLYQIPVREGLAFPEYSLLNFGDSFSLNEVDSLVNEGNGRNMGVEVTLEKFFKSGYYGLLTVSLFDSKYTGSDGIWRNSAFDGGYISNLLGGYEWKFRRNHSINFDLKFMYAGGKRFVPVDIEGSMAAQRTVYLWEQAYEEKYPDFLKIDLRMGYNLNLPAASHRFAIDLQNITNHQNLLVQRVDPVTGEIKNDFQIGFFPMITYKIEFYIKKRQPVSRS